MRLPMQERRSTSRRRSRWWTPFWQPASTILTPPTAIWTGRSETALKACLTSRYPREDYVLTNKLTANFFQNGGGHPALF